ncbi:Tetratricopeptide-like helical [Penicillium digitatum]|uniref:Tetratricopeptide repeat domain protein n=3 Tax=Penicillium digitatum TaxID=36651 RepID=K9FSX1_PEND2|nr:hypothetical protein PDIP_42390 [Penicillium digitatum Pd1]EKV11597.1 hypothetical protein PDIG_49530 [Penicillium digitatum PHI26]EKV14846.1 hypothetical protein PDIP_42390 [Penicillium digitatum Pd1]QQK46383.1 Tetratricopeptide-like helical [Penicillium digitatum]
MSEDPYYDLGSYQLLVKTTSPECQGWFDRGYRWAQGFNHGEAARCFRKAIAHDETCAMAYWGLSYALGPNYNKAWIRFDPSDLLETTTEARHLLQKAQTYTTQATMMECALIEALKARFPRSDVFPDDLGSLDRSYGEAMRPVYEKFPDDLDIAALTAEAFMCFTPRGLWNLDTGKPTGQHTVLAREIIERAMTLPGGAEHPALCHLYIHLMEMSPYPEIALPAADRLRFLMPDASHLLHMPTHIDLACGDYRRAMDSNHQAMLVDDKFFARTEGTTLYKLYRAHNIYVKLYSALMSGRFKEALSAANRLPGILTTEVLSISSPPMADWVESFLGGIVHVLVRFGRWEEILQNLPIPEDKQLYCSTTSMIYYGRGIALAVLGRVDEAKLAQAKFETARALVPRTRLSSLPAREVDVLKVASAMLQGEIQYRERKFDAAFRSLREAVALEDHLPYSDPPPWMQPTRHALGALLLEQGHLEEAELVYREDLGLSDSLPRRKARLNNVWGLHGLHECLTQTGKIGEAKVIGTQKELALASADVPIAASCFCRLSNSEGTEGPQPQKSECCA